MAATGGTDPVVIRVGGFSLAGVFTAEKMKGSSELEVEETNDRSEELDSVRCNLFGRIAADGRKEGLKDRPNCDMLQSNRNLTRIRLSLSLNSRL